MSGEPSAPVLLRALKGEAAEVRATPYGSVGTILDCASTGVVWVCKQDEDIDPGWFSQPDTDMLCVVAGQLRVEFKAGPSATLTLRQGDVLVLPPDMACRAYRWPRGSKQAAVFLAVTARWGRAGQSAGDGRAVPQVPRAPHTPAGLDQRARKDNTAEDHQMHAPDHARHVSSAPRRAPREGHGR